MKLSSPLGTCEVRPATTIVVMDDEEPFTVTGDCSAAIAAHQDAHARSAGEWRLACAEGWCGCPKDCGRTDCTICPTQGGPA